MPKTEGGIPRMVGDAHLGTGWGTGWVGWGKCEANQQRQANKRTTRNRRHPVKINGQSEHAVTSKHRQACGSKSCKSCTESFHARGDSSRGVAFPDLDAQSPITGKVMGRENPSSHTTQMLRYRVTRQMVDESRKNVLKALKHVQAIFSYISKPGAPALGHGLRHCATCR